MYYIGNSIILNGEISPLSQQRPTGLDGETYEMLRIDGGRPLFLADHMARFEGSVAAQGCSLPACWHKVPALIDWLILCNGLSNCDVRFCLSADGTFQVGFVTSHYPTPQQYAEGVHCELLSAIREKPTAKIYHASMRQAASVQQDDCSAYESILVNEQKKVTEGSRSNIFFIRGKQLFTAPNEMVLHGIMRKKVLELAQKCQFVVNFAAQKTDEIMHFDAAFLSSTPMRILPIATIGETHYDVQNTAIRQLMSALGDEIEAQKRI